MGRKQAESNGAGAAKLSVRRRFYDPRPDPIEALPDLPPSPEDGHFPPNPVGCRYGNLPDAGKKLISAQRALIRQQIHNWEQSQRFVKGASAAANGGEEDNESEDLNSTGALDSMLRENGVIPIDEPTGLGAGWDCALSGSDDSEPDEFGARLERVWAREDGPSEKEERFLTWVGWIRKKAREGFIDRVKSRRGVTRD